MDDDPSRPVPLAAVLRGALADSILPFWRRSVDRIHGGIFTCWNNAGTHLLSRDKYTWSQGRFVWLWSRLAEATAAGLLPGSAENYLAEAEQGARFLERHAFLENGNCAFLLAENGVRKESAAGRPLDASIYADCFVAMGFAGLGRAARDPKWLAKALAVFDRIERRIALGGFASDPTPIPEGYESHAIAMITLNVALVASEACDALGHPRAAELRTRCVRGAEHIQGRFLQPGGRIAEMLPRAGGLRDNLLCRHVNPGHALESLWLLLAVGRREGRDDWLERQAEAVKFAFRAGWDRAQGGLFHYVDCEGGPPTGASSKSAYEESLLRTWDRKLWWVHSEAIYTSLLARRLTSDEAIGALFEQAFDYAFRTFPHPDPAIGEWVQIRDRAGSPVDEVVALPVKDPYHVARNLLLALELVSENIPQTV